MPDTQTFPTADRVSFYVINGNFYKRVLQSAAIHNPGAIRAVPGESGSIAWFVPVKISDLVPENGEVE